MARSINGPKRIMTTALFRRLVRQSSDSSYRQAGPTKSQPSEGEQMATVMSSIFAFSGVTSASFLFVSICAFTAAAGLLYATSAFAQPPVAPTPGPLPIFAVDLHWTRLPGTLLEAATLAGSRSQPGLYIQLVRWPPHTNLKAHSHPDDRYAVVLRGTFYHGFGDGFDEANLEKRPSGTFFTEPKGVRHFGATKSEGAVLYFVGNGPTAIMDPEP